MKKEIIKILDMVDSEIISPDEAIDLIDAVRAVHKGNILHRKTTPLCGDAEYVPDLNWLAGLNFDKFVPLGKTFNLVY